MELKDYLRVLRRNWLILVVAVLVGVFVAGGISLLITPKYKSQTKLFVALQNSSSVSELQQGNVFTQARVRSYVETVSTPVVLQPVIESLGLSDSPAVLANKITATSDANTVLITISVADESPIQAASIAQAVGASLISAVDVLEKPARGEISPVKLSIVTPAVAATSPVSPNTRINLILGFLAGLACGVGIIALRSVLDTRIRGEIDLRRVTSSPVLGGISFDTEAIRKPLLTQAEAQSPRAESFRQLRTNLQFAHVSRRSKSVLMTSSLPGEGKSTTAVNLAMALAQAGQAVALVDADLRRPMVAEYLGLERNAGLTTALIGHANLDDLLQPWGEDNLYVLTSGQVPPNPSELLGSEAMRNVILRLESQFDAVIIDAPPLLPVTDAAVLAQQVGGVVLVAGTHKVRNQDLEKALAGLEMVEADLLGVVLNRLPAKGPDAYAYTYYGNESQNTPQVRPPRPNSAREVPSDNFDRLLSGAPRNESRLRSVRSRSTSGE